MFDFCHATGLVADFGRTNILSLEFIVGSLIQELACGSRAYGLR
jgi:hypothetical protein